MDRYTSLVSFVLAGSLLCCAVVGAPFGFGLSGAVNPYLQGGGLGNAGRGIDADTVDGFHASGTPQANTLLALDGSMHFPVSVIPNNSITGGKLAFGAVTAGRLADNSVTTTKIVNGAIRGEDVGIPLLMGGSRDGYLIGCFNSDSGSSASGICGYSMAASGPTRGVVGASNSTAGKGVYGVAKAASGLAYGVYGEANSTSGTGVFGYATAASGYTTGLYGRADSPDGYGVYSYGDCRVHGDLTVTGSKTGYVVDVVLNGGQEPLYPGDLVEIVSYTEPVVGRIPVAVVCKTTTPESRAVLGPIDSAVSVTPTEIGDDPPVSGDDPALYNVKRAEGGIAPGEYGRVVTVGLYERIKVDASSSPIYPGDLLVSSSAPGYAMACDDPKVGTVVGKALGGLESGIGEIPVFVSSR
jgi:hypothetical protein